MPVSIKNFTMKKSANGVDKTPGLWYNKYIKNERKVITMTIIEMKQTIIKTFGKDSFEAGYAQYVFSKRDSETFIEVYKKLMREKG